MLASKPCNGSPLARHPCWTRIQREGPGVPVSYGEDGPSLTFFLLVSFSRFRFRPSPELVSACFSSILGGTSSNFASLQLDSQIFRFVVSCKCVGLLVLKLGSFSCDSFKLAFFLCNDSGFQAAANFSKVDSGPSFPSTEVNHKKKKNDSFYADVVYANLLPLLCANTVPLGNSSHVARFKSPRYEPFNRTSCRGFHPAASNSNHSEPRISVFKRISFPRHLVFEHLEFHSKAPSQGFQILNQKSKGQPRRPNTVASHKWYLQKVLIPQPPKNDLPIQDKMLAL